MNEKIPYMNQRQAQEDYEKVISDLLGDSSRFKIVRAAITPGLIVNKRSKIPGDESYPLGIHRIYILGIPAEGTRAEQRGVGIMCDPEEGLLKTLSDRGFSETKHGQSRAFLKQIDSTLDLLAELGHLESSVFSGEPQ
jgi:hypothetical protein